MAESSVRERSLRSRVSPGTRIRPLGDLLLGQAEGVVE